MLRRLLPILAILFFILPAGAEESSGRLIKVWEENNHGKNKVFLRAYIPDDGNKDKKAVIICPGGSYFWLAEIDEGEKVGELLCSRGIAAFVLSYRVAGKFNFITDFRLFGGNQYPSMLEDTELSLQIVRSLSDDYGIDEDGIGIMGFSAGGHLAMLTEESGAKPAFVAMFYPVVTLSDSKIVHKRSRRGILGTMSGNKKMRDSLSLEKNVPNDCCPVFLLHCEDDTVVDFNNSVALDSALAEKGIPHKFIRASRGGHGFGTGEIEVDGKSYSWIDDFTLWLQERSF